MTHHTFTSIDDIVRVSKERNHSDLPHGDEDPVRAAKRFNMTTNKFHFDDVSSSTIVPHYKGQLNQ